MYIKKTTRRFGKSILSAWDKGVWLDRRAFYKIAGLLRTLYISAYRAYSNSLEGLHS
jgi:hypothetical protein